MTDTAGDKDSFDKKSAEQPAPYFELIEKFVETYFEMRMTSEIYGSDPRELAMRLQIPFDKDIEKIVYVKLAYCTVKNKEGDGSAKYVKGTFRFDDRKVTDSISICRVAAKVHCKYSGYIDAWRVSSTRHKKSGQPRTRRPVLQLSGNLRHFDLDLFDASNLITNLNLKELYRQSDEVYILRKNSLSDKDTTLYETPYESDMQAVSSSGRRAFYYSVGILSCTVSYNTPFGTGLGFVCTNFISTYLNRGGSQVNIKNLISSL